MRNWIIGAAALLAAAVPGVAAAGTGYAGVSFTGSNVEIFGSDTDVDTWTGEGVAAFNAYELGVQLDGRISSAEFDSGGEVDSWSLGGHVFKRGDGWLLGGYVGLGNIEFGSSDADEWTVALEAQVHMDRTTFTGGISRSEVDDVNVEVTSFDVGARHFVNDNFALDANIGFGNIALGPVVDLDTSTYGVGGEYQLASLPVSIYGTYQHSELDDINLEIDSFMIGARYNWGGTLFDRDRSGASLPRRGLGRALGGIV